MSHKKKHVVIDTYNTPKLEENQVIGKITDIRGKQVFWFLIYRIHRLKLIPELKNSLFCCLRSLKRSFG